MHLRNEDQIKKADLVMAIHSKTKIPKKIARLLPPSAWILGPEVDRVNFEGLSPQAKALAIVAFGLMLLG